VAISIAIVVGLKRKRHAMKIWMSLIKVMFIGAGKKT